MPLIRPEPRYFSMPSREFGGTARMKTARNCCPCSRWTSQRPLACWSPRNQDETRYPMSQTSDKGSVVTLINLFTVDPANQQRLVDLLTRATDGFVNRAPGFVSSTLHRSTDGTKVPKKLHSPS